MKEADKAAGSRFRAGLGQDAEMILPCRRTYLFPYNKVGQGRGSSATVFVETPTSFSVIRESGYPDTPTAVDFHCSQAQDCVLSGLTQRLGMADRCRFHTYLTVSEPRRVSIRLGYKGLGLSAAPLRGQLPQEARLEALNKFRRTSRSLLVASDLAARMGSIYLWSMLFSITIFHRTAKLICICIGSAGPPVPGKSGHAFSFATPYAVELRLSIEGALGRKLDEYAIVKDHGSHDGSSACPTFEE